MITITHKSETLRTAKAMGMIRANPETILAIKEKRIPKGDVLQTARVAGIMASKKTPELLPLCHPLPLEGCEIDFQLNEDCVEIVAQLRTVAKTGLEMEALTAVSVAALTLYDMLKPIDKNLEITGIKLVDKKGGKSQFKETIREDFSVAVIVTSDGTFQGTRQDKSGQIILERLKGFGIKKVEYLVLPDEKDQIVQKLNELCEKDLILTTGGSGLGPRDVTVEATREVIEREVPGIAETMRYYGQRRTPYAMLSRGLVGIKGRTLIVNLPGSSKGTAESMDAIFPALFHSYSMIDGQGH